MKNEEEKIDDFLSDIISETGLESPPSKYYTNQVMLQVTLLRQKPIRITKTNIALIGVLLYSILSVIIYFLWQAGSISNIVLNINNVLQSLMGFLSFEKFVFIGCGIGIYLIIVRILLTVFFFNREVSNFKQY